jgi:NAD(P)H-nitrite reductase large subunit
MLQSPLQRATSMSTTNANQADEIMCDCSCTTRRKIQSLFEQCLSMDDISSWFGAISDCGSCEWDIAQFLNTCRAKAIIALKH